MPANSYPTTLPGNAPMKSILDPSFRYVSSSETDVRKTFARIRRERGENIGDPETAKSAVNANVVRFRPRATARKG